MVNGDAFTSAHTVRLGSAYSIGLSQSSVVGITDLPSPARDGMAYRSYLPCLVS